MPRNTRSLLTILVAFLLTADCVASDQSKGLSTNANHPTRSLNSDTKALITFVNRSGQSVNIYWIDFGGNRQLYKTLEAGGSFSQQTYLTHPWLITDAGGRPWNVYMPQARPRTVYLQAPQAAIAR
jgi:hypothetical protein